MPQVISVIASLSVLGVHCWPQAHPPRAYLATPHQHLFIIEVQVEVKHEHRELEIHDLRGMVSDFLHDQFPTVGDSSELDFGTFSCESIAAAIANYLRADMGKATITVRVFEDVHGNGAVVTDVCL